MTDFDRNVRTLIVCFVVAVFGLIPLRFIEVGNSVRVLGESTVIEVKDEVKLPNAEVETVELEAPYDEVY